jgi:hypothetical protein
VISRIACKPVGLQADRPAKQYRSMLPHDSVAPDEAEQRAGVLRELA